MNKQQPALFDRIGGMDAVDAAVGIFYAKILADESISHFFKYVDMKTLMEKQKNFLSYVFGGPSEYTGKNMRSAHQEMTITEDNFNTVAIYLKETLEELKVDEATVNEVMAIALNAKDDVLRR